MKPTMIYREKWKDEDVRQRQNKEKYRRKKSTHGNAKQTKQKNEKKNVRRTRVHLIPWELNIAFILHFLSLRSSFIQYIKVQQNTEVNKNKTKNMFMEERREKKSTAIRTKTKHISNNHVARNTQRKRRWLKWRNCIGDNYHQPPHFF